MSKFTPSKILLFSLWAQSEAVQITLHKTTTVISINTNTREIPFPSVFVLVLFGLIVFAGTLSGVPLGCKFAILQPHNSTIVVSVSIGFASVSAAPKCCCKSSFVRAKCRSEIYSFVAI